MKVLLVADEGYLGGAEISTSRLLAALVERGIECAAAVPKGSPYWGRLKERGIPLFPCELNDLKRTFSRGYPILRENSRLRRLIGDFGPTVIHTDSLWAAFFTLMAASRSDIPVVSSLHSYPEAHRALKRAIFAVLKRLIVRKCAHFIVFSEHMLNEIGGRYGFPIDKVSRVHHGIERDRLEERLSRVDWRRKHDIPAGAVVFICITRIHPEKGVMDFVEAARIVMETDQDAFFVVAGEEVVTPLENLGFTKIIHRRLNELGLMDRFRFLGFQEDV
ncbi:MAG: glycosyltransferase family 4 protein, partial [Candidatus Coatesbacteria bacterium]|nr:glycosyltransferase family 4 protein [Candidatus Coatesbacteria bacterium]